MTATGQAELGVEEAPSPHRRKATLVLVSRPNLPNPNSDSCASLCSSLPPFERPAAVRRAPFYSPSRSDCWPCSRSHAPASYASVSVRASLQSAAAEVDSWGRPPRTWCMASSPAASFAASFAASDLSITSTPPWVGAFRMGVRRRASARQGQCLLSRTGSACSPSAAGAVPEVDHVDRAEAVRVDDGLLSLWV